MKANPVPDLVAKLIRAHHDKSPLAVTPALVPASFDAAMHAQAATVSALGAKVGGWKVGFAPDGTPVAGPMLAHDIQQSGASWPLPPAGAVIVEVEIAVRLAHDLPVRPGNPYVRADIVAACAEVLVGIELICSRLDQGMAAPFPAWLADRLGNTGYIYGSGRRDMQGLELAKLRCVLKVDGAIVHDRIGGHPQTDPLAPLLGYANAPSDHLGGLRAGQIVTTGSLIVPLPCATPMVLAAEIEGLGSVEFRLVR